MSYDDDPLHNDELVDYERDEEIVDEVDDEVEDIDPVIENELIQEDAPAYKKPVKVKHIPKSKKKVAKKIVQKKVVSKVIKAKKKVVAAAKKAKKTGKIVSIKVQKPKSHPKKKVVAKPKVHKAKGSDKRGPKDKQWKNWKIPLQESSIGGRMFLLASKRGGIKIKELTKLVTKWGGNASGVLKRLRAGSCRGWVWDTDDSKGRIRVSNWKIGNKSWKGDY